MSPLPARPTRTARLGSDATWTNARKSFVSMTAARVSATTFASPTPAYRPVIRRRTPCVGVGRAKKACCVFPIVPVRTASFATTFVVCSRTRRATASSALPTKRAPQVSSARSSLATNSALVFVQRPPPIRPAVVRIQTVGWVRAGSIPSAASTAPARRNRSTRESVPGPTCRSISRSSRRQSRIPHHVRQSTVGQTPARVTKPFAHAFLGNGYDSQQ